MANGQRQPGTSVSPQTLANQEMQLRNQTAKMQADLERTRMQTEVQKQKMAQDAQIHKLKVSEMGANERQRMQQEGWDKQRAEEARQFDKRQADEKQQFILNQKLNNIRAGIGQDLGSTTQKAEQGAYNLVGKNPFPVNGSFEERAEHSKRWLQFKYDSNEELGRNIEAHSIAQAGVGNSREDLQRGMLRNLTIRQQQLMSLNDLENNLNTNYGNIMNGITGNNGLMLSVMTEMDKNRRGFWGEVWQGWENVTGGWLPLSNDVLLRPGQTEKQLPFYDQIFRGSGAGAGLNLANSAELGNAIQQIVADSRAGMASEVSKIMGTDLPLEALEGIPSYNEYNFGQNTGSATISEAKFNQGVALELKQRMGQNLTNREQADLSNLKAIIQETGVNPLVDPETIQAMNEGWTMEDKGVRAFSSNPLWGGTISAKGVGGQVAARRMAQQIANELGTTSDFANVGDSLMPVVSSIMDHIEAGSKNPQALKAKLEEFTLQSGDPTIFMLIDNIMDNWGNVPEANVSSAFVQQLKDAGIDTGNDDLMNEILATHREMTDVMGNISAVWNQVTGASAMNASQNRWVISGAQDYSLEELVKNAMQKGEGRVVERYNAATGKMEERMDYTQPVLDDIWRELQGSAFAGLPIEFKEAMYKSLGERIQKLDASAYQAAVGQYEESFGALDDFFSQMGEAEMQMQQEGIDIDLAEQQRQAAAINALLSEYEGL
tara:strand:+ start:872 stop:3028 length:2157 start_codon:yes stop_codon:yes gene_type:complete